MARADSACRERLEPGSLAVDARAIAESLGIFTKEVGVDTPRTEETRKFEEYIAGICAIQADGLQLIVVLPCKSKTKKAYTWAHELSHALRERWQIRATKRDDPEEERHAQKVAAEILMPMDRLLEAVAAIGIRPYSLARAFGVSPTAMRIRLRELGIIGRRERRERPRRAAARRLPPPQPPHDPATDLLVD